MTDDDFEKLLADYLDTSSLEMADIELDMNEGLQNLGADHALNDHGVTQQEIRQVIYELPAVEQKRSRHGAGRTLFWGSTRAGRDITIAAVDQVVQGVRR